MIIFSELLKKMKKIQPKKSKLYEKLRICICFPAQYNYNDDTI